MTSKIIIPKPKNPNSAPGWLCEVRSGHEVFRVVDGEVVRTPLTSRDDLKTGDLVATHAISGKVVLTPIGVCCIAGDWCGLPEFGTDSRGCWTCSGATNIAAMRTSKVVVS